MVINFFFSQLRACVTVCRGSNWLIFVPIPLSRPLKSAKQITVIWFIHLNIFVLFWSNKAQFGKKRGVVQGQRLLVRCVLLTGTIQIVTNEIHAMRWCKNEGLKRRNIPLIPFPEIEIKGTFQTNVFYVLRRCNWNRLDLYDMIRLTFGTSHNCIWLGQSISSWKTASLTIGQSRRPYIRAAKHSILSRSKSFPNSCYIAHLLNREMHASQG